MLTIYGYAASINVRKVLWACEELGLAFEREDWGGGFRSVGDPAFTALNPVGMVPVIDDGGTIVWESNTIVRYLAARHGRTDLLPADPTRSDSQSIAGSQRRFRARRTSMSIATTRACWNAGAFVATGAMGVRD